MSQSQDSKVTLEVEQDGDGVHVHLKGLAALKGLRELAQDLCCCCGGGGNGKSSGAADGAATAD